MSTTRERLRGIVARPVRVDTVTKGGMTLPSIGPLQMFGLGGRSRAYVTQCRRSRAANIRDVTTAVAIAAAPSKSSVADQVSSSEEPSTQTPRRNTWDGCSECRTGHERATPTARRIRHSSIVTSARSFESHAKSRRLAVYLCVFASLRESLCSCDASISGKPALMQTARRRQH